MAHRLLGAALLAAPIYAVWPDGADLAVTSSPEFWDIEAVDSILIPPFGPAALVAAAVTALAVAVAGLTARSIVGSVPALMSTYIFGLGTGACSRTSGWRPSAK